MQPHARALAPIGGRGLAADAEPHQRVTQSRALYFLSAGDYGLAAAALTPSLRSDLPRALDRCAAQLAPVEAEAIMGKLTPLLALTAGAGMAGGARTEWLAAAADALKGVPLDLLERGVKAARPIADHPSRIVPAIMGEIMPAWRERLRTRGAVRSLAELASVPDGASPTSPNPAADAIDPADVERMNGIMRRFGLTTRFNGDGSAFTLTPGADDPTAPAPEAAAD